MDLSDDEELKEAFDVHAIVSPMVPGATEEDINADDVIDEIDTIMKVGYSKHCNLNTMCWHGSLYDKECLKKNA